MVDFSKVCAHVESGVSFSSLTTIKVGGRVDWVCYPENSKELINTVKLCAKHKIKSIILGNGSNVLAKDTPFNGVVISTKRLNHISLLNGGKIKVGAGAMLSKVCAFCEKNNLTGIEKLCGIPGTIGGAVVMNAGAFGCEIGNMVESVCVLDMEMLTTITKSQLFFDYRASTFTNKQNCVILNVVLQLTKSTFIPNSLYYVLLKKQTQNVGYPSAGSVFKRNGDIIPAKLIEDCGLKGLGIGGAMVSNVHAGYIVNTGGATYHDILRLIKLVKKRVRERFGVELELEIRVIGG